MKNKISWGIISTGHIAGKFAEALKLLPEAELVAVASRKKEKAEKFADKYNIPRAYSNYQDLADDKNIDVVYIGTPHTFHLENSIMCMRKGKSILCEKAFTINAKEAKEMVKVAHEENVFLMEAMIPRHIPLIKKALGWVREERIGQVRMIRASRCARGEFTDESRILNPKLGGGSLLDLGVYVISFAFQVLGKLPVDSVGVSHIGHLGSDEQGVVLLKYDKGEIADLAFALRTEAVNDAYIFGTEGFIKLHDLFAPTTKISLYKNKKEIESIEEPIIGNALNYEAEEVMRCLNEGLKESPFMPLNESIQIMEVMDKIRKPWGLVYPND